VWIYFFGNEKKTGEKKKKKKKKSIFTNQPASQSTQRCAVHHGTSATNETQTDDIGDEEFFNRISYGVRRRGPRRRRRPRLLLWRPQRHRRLESVRRVFAQKLLCKSVALYH
jgi:hypothetical protein